MIDEVGAFLAGAGLGLTVGTNLFLNDLPPTADGAELDPCAAILESDGQGAEHVLHDLIAPLEQPRLLVLARAEDEPTARRIAQGMKRALRGVVNQTLTAPDATSAYYLCIEPEGETTVVDRDQNERVTSGFTALVMRESSAGDAT